MQDLRFALRQLLKNPGWKEGLGARDEGLDPRAARHYPLISSP